MTGQLIKVIKMIVEILLGTTEANRESMCNQKLHVKWDGITLIEDRETNILDGLILGDKLRVEYGNTRTSMNKVSEFEQFIDA